MTRTTVVVVTWRAREHLARCLAALSTQDRPHRTLVVDNAADRHTTDVLTDYPVEVLRLPVNVGYAGGLAAALPRVDTEYLAWLNDDAVPEPGWLAALEDALDQRPEAAAAGSLLLTPEGAVQATGTRLDADGYGADATTARPFGFCGGAVLVRTAALRAVGGVPAEFFCYYEDTDTSWRLRLAGQDIVHVPAARVTHAHGASGTLGSPRFHRWNEENRLRMLIRCAPTRVVARALATFLPVLARRPARTPNYTLALRLAVLAALARDAPRLAAQRAWIGRHARVSRDRVWRAWAGCDATIGPAR